MEIFVTHKDSTAMKTSLMGRSFRRWIFWKHSKDLFLINSNKLHENKVQRPDDGLREQKLKGNRIAGEVHKWWQCKTITNTFHYGWTITVDYFTYRTACMLSHWNKKKRISQSIVDSDNLFRSQFRQSKRSKKQLNVKANFRLKCFTYQLVWCWTHGFFIPFRPM